jgi:hypothetical protein
MADPEVRAVRYWVSCIPEDLTDFGDVFTVVVEYCGQGLWSVTNRGIRHLGADGTWSQGYRGPFSDREPVTPEEHHELERRYEQWLSLHRFDKETALRLARAAAPKLTVRNLTAAEALAEYARRSAAE